MDTSVYSWSCFSIGEIMKHGISDLIFNCYTKEAREWYMPLKPYTLLEYQWVKDNITLTKDTVVIDAGCHHGNYSVVFKPAYVIAIDNNPECLTYAMQNMELNDIKFLGILETVGRFGASTNLSVDIYKVDIEGDEFKLFPHEIDNFPTVHTWIIEIHPKHGNPETIANYFIERNFTLLKVDRDTMQVRNYVHNEKWNGHATLIARKSKDSS
jgi:hypothetical protein